jgi:ATP-binding cassette subfamily B protein
MGATQPLFALILLGWLIVHLGITLFFLHQSGHLWEMHSEAVANLSGKIVDVFSNMLNVRLFARRNYEASYLGKSQREEIIKAKKAMWQVEIMRIGLGINGVCLLFGMLGTLLYGWVHHWVTAGDFTQVMMQTIWLMGWMWFITFQLTDFVRERAIISNALKLIRRSHDLTDRQNAYPLQVTHGEICFDRVSFAYEANRAVFNQLNMTIPGGQKIGLVGYSGSGKSTFLNLILRFYDVQAGRILIDHQDISDVTQDSLRAQIALIPQEPALFHRTLMENIRYGRIDATDEEVIKASQLAHCHEFIEKLDDGYQAMVGERGVKLSGGQRQRIAIARAMLKNAPILILDEATSALDSVTEKLIQQSLHILMQGRTTIVVAHRLSTLSDLDKIIVFDKGTIVEAGTKEQLLDNQGYFARLWNMQTQGFLPDDESN